MPADRQENSRPRLLAALAAWTVATGLVAAGAGEPPSAGGASPGAARPPVVVPQGNDGTILLSGSHAMIRGRMLRWEPQAHKRTLGYWTQADDAAEWAFLVSTPGAFEVEVLQGCGTGQGGSAMTVVLDSGRAAASTLRFVVEDTGGFQEFRPLAVGRFTIADAGEHALRIKPERIAKHAACDIRQVRLVPVQPEAVAADREADQRPSP